MNGRVILAMARADFLERARRYSFFVTLLFAIFLGYLAATGKVLIQLDNYRGVYTSGWIGTLMALVVTCFVSLIGFYIVKNCVERDRATGVGAILAATPLSKSEYAVGKWLSSFAALSSIVVILAVAAILMQFMSAEDPRVNLWALLSPFLLIALPAMAVTAALALCFEMTPGLRGGGGNVAWFFVWTLLLSLPALAKRSWLDPIGMITVMNSLAAQAKNAIPGYHGGIAFQIEIGQRIQVAENLRWNGVDWRGSDVLVRLLWLGSACAMVVIVSQFFDRFDRTRASHGVPDFSARERGDARSAASERVLPVATAARLTPPQRASGLGGFFQAVVAELRLALRGCRWWWYTVALGLLIAQFTAPLSAARGPLLGVAWIWPALLWSGLGTREKKDGTESLIFSCPENLRRQFPASWVAGIFIAMTCGLGAAVRLSASSDFSGTVGWLAGAVFVPTLALALGAWSGTSKFFEGAYTALWYVGPMNHTAGMDYTGGSNGSQTLFYAGVYLAVTVVLLASAFARRKTQLQNA